jgi:hypothetical protein
MKNQEKQHEVSTHLVAPLSLTQKSNFPILADVKGEFLSVHFNTTWNALSMYYGALAPSLRRIMRLWGLLKTFYGKGFYKHKYPDNAAVNIRRLLCPNVEGAVRKAFF